METDRFKRWMRIFGSEQAVRHKGMNPPRPFCTPPLNPYQDAGRPYTRVVENPPGLEALTSRILSAIRRRQVIRVRYQTGIYTPVEELMILPLHLYFDRPTWYLFAQSDQGQHLDPLDLTRILEVLVLDRYFADIERFDLAGVLGRVWSTPSGGPIYPVKLWFPASIADRVIGIQWHGTQKASRQPDGSAIVEFRLDRLDEITWWVRSFGDQVRVLSPMALRERLSQTTAPER